MKALPLRVIISAIVIIIAGSWILSQLLDPPWSWLSAFLWGLLCGFFGVRMLRQVYR